VKEDRAIQFQSARRFLFLAVATGFGTGYSKVAPGTVGSLLGFFLFLPLQELPLFYALPLWSALFGAGVYASNAAIHFLGEKDPKSVVIDEIAAIILVLFLVPASLPWQLLGFLLFRLFDITKPLGVREAESLPLGWGIMADDFIAAIYAIILVRLTHAIIGL
jgi:phosphatidylglycerophosphatase A